MTRHLLNKLLFVPAAFAVLLGIATTAYGGLPPIDVTVFDANSKVAFKGPISANATFATGNLHPGHYVVQFNAKSPAVKDNQYLLVVSAGKKKVIAPGVRGETLIAGGAAMRLDVELGSKITGQVANEQDVARGDGPKYRLIDGKLFVWVTAELGSNRGGHWEEPGLAPARNITAWNSDDFRRRQDRGGEGSLITYTDHYGPGSKGF
jgi:hypothetical protein